MKIKFIKDHKLHKLIKKGTIDNFSNDLAKKLIKLRVAKEYKELKPEDFFKKVPGVKKLVKDKPVKFETKDEYLKK